MKNASLAYQHASKVVTTATVYKFPGVVPAKTRSNLVADNTPMPSYNPSDYDAPGSTVFRMREKLGWSQRRLAHECNPEIDHTTIRRVEHNRGYTQDTLERIAAALSKGFAKRLTVSDLFLDPRLADFAELPEAIQDRLAQSVREAAIAYRVTKNTED